jgi:hypothetical protein
MLLPHSVIIGLLASVVSGLEFVYTNQAPLVDYDTNFTYDVVSWGYQFNSCGHIEIDDDTKITINTGALVRQLEYFETMNVCQIVKREESTLSAMNLTDVLYLSLGDIAYHTNPDKLRADLVKRDAYPIFTEHIGKRWYSFCCFAWLSDMYVEYILGITGKIGDALRYATNQSFWSTAESMTTVVSNLVGIAGQVTTWLDNTARDGNCGGGTYNIYDGSGNNDNKNILTIGVSSFSIAGGQQCSPDNTSYNDRWVALQNALRDWEGRDVVGGCATLSNSNLWRGNVRMAYAELLAQCGQNLWDMSCVDI